VPTGATGENFNYQSFFDENKPISAIVQTTEPDISQRCRQEKFCVLNPPGFIFFWHEKSISS